jgi:hypothetical protein
MPVKKWIFYLCTLCIVINTVLFPLALVMDQDQIAFFHLLCALGCWVGYFNYKNSQGE